MADDTNPAASLEADLENGRTEQSLAARSVGDPERIRAFAVEAAGNLIDNKCEDIVILDVTELSPITDYVVVGSGTSDRQMNAALSHLEDLGKERGFSCWRSHKDDRSTWLLADFVDVVVHLFEPSAREYYDIEMLWKNAPRIEPPKRGPTSRPGFVG